MSLSTNVDGEARLWAALREVRDPELPVSVVDLGLIYDVQITDGHVDVEMTLTAQGCPASREISHDVQNTILSMPGVNSAAVRIVWDPPWHQSRITPEGRRLLGLE